MTVTRGRNNLSSPSSLSSLQKKAEAAHRILEGLGPQVELVSVTSRCGERELGQVWRGPWAASTAPCVCV